MRQRVTAPFDMDASTSAGEAFSQTIGREVS
jgi:hypothetical protein